MKQIKKGKESMNMFGDDVKMFASIIFEAIENDMLNDGYVPGETVSFEYAVRKDMNAVFVAVFDNKSDVELFTAGVPLKGIRYPEQIGETIIEQFKAKIANLQNMLNSY